MTAIKSYSKPEAGDLQSSTPHSRRPLGSGAARSALAALGATALAMGCAGELDKDPNSFNHAFADTPAAGSGTGGATATGGSGAMGGGAPTGGTVGTTGGAGTGGAAGVIPPDDACVAAVFSAKACLACHSKAAASLIGADLVLEGTELGKRLSTTVATYKGVQATMNPAACVPGALIIDPGMPTNSILLKKVAGTQVCGDKMPQGTGLTGADLQCITDWINKF